ncbi:hypothetical protein BDB00DRAFT_826808 [Zychaea mexicana]|uniref:uncharacterized protein n=1 Tax=Zychaea mexicana TaxID=64656 RepID=UPI0022FE329D|nr:uncharacterized protein BDB00DRAFT_826808 [Zychaea mexicana]KAI9492701.1 hypothetical protein BDB00DRAFT_826808 [Zychaea mexicana]
MHHLLLSLIINAIALICCVHSAPLADFLQLSKRAAAVPCANQIDTLFVFGDSYSAVNGEKGSRKTWTLFESPDSVTNNPVIRDGTTAGAPNWNQYLTECYEGIPQNCPAHLFNVAYNGATVDTNLVQPRTPDVSDFIAQVQGWQKHVKPQVEYQKALAAIWFGINDVGHSLDTSDADISALLGKDVDEYFDQLELLYSGGLRTFMIINVPPFERTPKFSPQADILVPRIMQYNELIDNHITAFTTKHQDVAVIKIDAHERFTYYLDHASQYGVQDTTSSCKEKEGDEATDCGQ